MGLDPSDGEAWLVLGGAYQAMGNTGQAKRCYNACVSQGKKGPISDCKDMLEGSSLPLVELTRRRRGWSQRQCSKNLRIFSENARQRRLAQAIATHPRDAAREEQARTAVLQTW